MALTQITYNDKSNYQSSSLANEYKVSASDLNEIKSVVNGVCTQVDNSTSYSTTEKVIGAWTDGKPIYRKVISFGSLPNNGSKQVAHSIPINNPLRAYGYAYNSGTSAKLTFPWSGIDVTLDLSYVAIKTDIDRSNYVGYVVIEYTKSTD